MRSRPNSSLAGFLATMVVVATAIAANLAVHAWVIPDIGEAAADFRAVATLELRMASAGACVATHMRRTAWVLLRAITKASIHGATPKAAVSDSGMRLPTTGQPDAPERDAP